MATGDADDMQRRMLRLMPAGWFADIAPVRDAVHGGIADSLAWLYGLLQTVKAGTRRAGTTGWLLDVDAWGFFGPLFLRTANESDASWRTRYTNEIFRPRVTIPAIKQALLDLTGEAPDIVEPWTVGGGYGCGALAYGGGVTNAPAVDGYGAPIGGYGVGAASYGVPSGIPAKLKGAGFYGSLVLPYQIFITAYRPRTSSLPNVAGYGITTAGYGCGAIEYATEADSGEAIADDEIYACVARTIAGGITAWVAIVDVSGNTVVPLIGLNTDLSVPGNPFAALA